MNPPDAPVLGADAPIDFVAHFLRHIPRMLHKLTIEIHHVESAVRPDREIDRMKPRIRGSEELLAVFAASGFKGDSLRHEHSAMHEVAQGFADKDVSLVLFTQSVAAIDCGSCRRVEVGLRFVVEHLRRSREREDATVVAGRLKVLRRLCAAEERNAIQVACFDHDMPKRHRVPGEKAIAPVVERSAKLALAGDGFELARVGPKAEVVSANGDLLVGGIVRSSDFPIAPAVRAIDPIVEATGQAVHKQLLIALAETGEQHASLIGLAVAVVVSEKPNVRRRRHQHAIVPRQNARRKRKLVGEHSRAFVPAINVAVLQESDTSRCRPGRIVSHFDDEHPAIGIPGDANRTDHLRFGSD